MYPEEYDVDDGIGTYVPSKRCGRCGQVIRGGK